MACSCHGKNGVAVTSARFDDQCTTCARKHINNAVSKWGEFTYELDNRDYVSSQLRDAADHLKYQHRDTALKCRDLAVVIEEIKDQNTSYTADELRKLQLEIRNLYFSEHPDAVERLDKLQNP
jgi:hypothetical protein